MTLKVEECGESWAVSRSLPPSPEPTLGKGQYLSFIRLLDLMFSFCLAGESEGRDPAAFPQEGGSGTPSPPSGGKNVGPFLWREGERVWDLPSGGLLPHLLPFDSFSFTFV